jgi:uncharacterized membrane protein
MTKNRLEAFSDGVLAIVLTIMVLELKPPHSGEVASLLPLIPKFVSYVLSFVYVGIYWNNHHHMFQVVKRVDGTVLWANMHLLFWLSLLPFVTAWSGENHFAPVPVATYGAVLFMAALAYYILTRALLRSHGPDSELGRALGSDYKGKISAAMCAAAIPLALVSRWSSLSIYAIVAMVWLIPDRRMAKVASSGM